MTVRELAAALSNRFQKDFWGDIDPILFHAVAEGGPRHDDDDEMWRDIKGMEKVLAGVIKDLKLEDA